MTRSLDPRIPAQWHDYWEPASQTPGELVHFTSPLKTQRILRSGIIKPMDPAPRDWEGLHAVFMCDPKDPSFDERFLGTGHGNLVDHFYCCSYGITALWPDPEKIGPLYRCLVPEKRSYYITLDPVPLQHLREVYAFASHPVHGREAAEEFDALRVDLMEYGFLETS